VLGRIGVGCPTRHSDAQTQPEALSPFVVGYDVHAHLVDQARGKHLATDLASGDLDQVVTRKLLGLATAASTPSTK
jgi:hypothetical protein